MNDHQDLYDDENWEFIHSRDDDPNLLKKFENNKYDIIYIDSLHEPNHVKKIFYMYYDLLKVGGRVFLDDINWLPYVKNSFKDSEYSEVMNRRIFSKIIEIYYSNLENMKLEFSFVAQEMQIFRNLMIISEMQKIRNEFLDLELLGYLSKENQKCKTNFLF